MEISNWTQKERKEVALNLSIRARNRAAHIPLTEDKQKFVYECLEVVVYLLDDGISARFLEVNRVQVLEHYRE